MKSPGATAEEFAVWHLTVTLEMIGRVAARLTLTIAAPASSSTLIDPSGKVSADAGWSLSRMETEKLR